MEITSRTNCVKAQYIDSAKGLFDRLASLDLEEYKACQKARGYNPNQISEAYTRPESPLELINGRLYKRYV